MELRRLVTLAVFMGHLAGFAHEFQYETPKGYENLNSETCSSILKVFIEDRNEPVNLMALADHLQELENPRGEHIVVRLALNSDGLSEKHREQLQERAKELEEAHKADWVTEGLEDPLFGHHGQVVSGAVSAQNANQQFLIGLFSKNPWLRWVTTPWNKSSTQELAMQVQAASSKVQTIMKQSKVPIEEIVTHWTKLSGMGSVAWNKDGKQLEGLEKTQTNWHLMITFNRLRSTEIRAHVVLRTPQGYHPLTSVMLMVKNKRGKNFVPIPR